MTTATNGKTQKKQRRDDNSFLPDSSEALGGIEATSGINGTQPDGFDFEYSSRENFSQQFDGGNTCTGKILTRLKQIELEHLAYIDEHQHLMEILLEESKQREAKFREAIRELEQEIQSLMSGETQ